MKCIIYRNFSFIPKFISTNTKFISSNTKFHSTYTKFPLIYTKFPFLITEIPLIDNYKFLVNSIGCIRYSSVGKKDSNLYKIENIRNIGISAHIDSGKTTLTERILFYAGKIDAIHEVRGTDGVGAKMDSMDLEREKGITIQSAVTNINWNINSSSPGIGPNNTLTNPTDYSINIIDTPGHVDFTIEVERSLRVLDSAVLLVCSVSGVQSQTVTVFRQMDRYKIPRIIFLNKLDREGASIDRCIHMLQSKLGVNLLQLQIPIGTGPKLEGIIDLIEMKAYYFRGQFGELMTCEDIPENMSQEAEKLNFQLLEKIADHNNDFAQKYLESNFNLDDIRNTIRQLTLERIMYPLLMGSAKGNKGVQLLLDSICYYLPSPKNSIQVYKYQNSSESDETNKIILNEDYKGLIGYIFKIVDTHLGQLSYIRIYKGILKRGLSVLIVEEDKRVILKRLFRVHSDEVLEVSEAREGEIVAISGLKCPSGVTITDGKQVTMKPMHVPEPVVSMALKHINKSDSVKLSKALNRFQKEDPTFRINIDQESKETILSGMGELHLNIYLERMKREYGLNIEVGEPIVNYRETITTKAEFNYTHKRQSGGVGQYAKVIGYIEPIKDNPNHHLNIQFINQFIGNDIKSNYIISIENGFKEICKKGLLCGRPVVNVRFVLTDGASHDVDSSDLAFRLATYGAFEMAYREAEPIILEPIMSVEVTAPQEFQSQTLSTLTKRKGIITNTNIINEIVIINANVPLKSMFGYITDLRSATKGQGEYNMEFKYYEQMSKIEQEEEMKKYDKLIKKN